jgi:hypothetical protein
VTPQLEGDSVVVWEVGLGRWRPERSMVVAYTPTKGAAMIFRGKILAIVAPIDEGSGRGGGVA